MATEEKEKVMEEKKTIWHRIITFQMRHRNLMLLLICILTGYFGYHCVTLRIHTDFFELYPPRHPYIQLYKEYRKMFGTANVMSLVLEVKKGDIYNAETFNKLDFITQRILTIKGGDSLQVVSLVHPRLKNVGVGFEGLRVNPLVPVLPKTAEELRSIKERVYSNEGVRGLYVSLDDKASLIYAGFWEEGVDMRHLFNELMKLKKEVEDSNHTLYMTGYPMLYAWIHHYVPQIAYVLFITGAVLLILLWFYFRSWLGVIAPLASGVVSAVWGLGFAGALGFSIDPLVLVVPLLLSARAISHSVQGNERYHEEYARLGDKDQAIIFTYANIYKPAVLGILTDGLGVLTIGVATIPLMRNLSFFASFWIASIFASSVILHPVLVALLPAPKGKMAKEKVHELESLKAATDEIEKIEAGFRPADRLYVGISKFLLFLSGGRKKWVVGGIVLLTVTAGAYYAESTLKVGDTSAGKAILYADHPYNVGWDKVNKDFVGASQLIVVAEGKRKEVMKDPRALQLLEDMGIYSTNEIPVVGGTVSVTDICKGIFRMFHEGEPKWMILPDNPTHMAQVLYVFTAGLRPGEAESYMSQDYKNATLTLYLRDYDNQIIKDTISQEHELLIPMIEGTRKNLEVIGDVMNRPNYGKFIAVSGSISF